MKQIIWKYWIFSVTGYGLLLSLIFIILGIWTTISLNRYFKKKKKEKYWFIPKGFVFVLLWLVVVGLILLANVPRYDKIIILKNSTFDITLSNLIVILVILFVNLFVIRTLKLQVAKRGGILKNRTLHFIVDIILWLVSLHLIAKIILPAYGKLINYKLFSIKDISITVYDIYFILISLTLTGVVVVAIKLLLDRQTKINRIDESTALTIFKVSKYIIWTFSLLFILQTIGFNLSLILAGSAALLVGLGIGIQQVFNDIVSGIIILFEQNLKVGDIVEVQGIVGKVLDIGFRTTTVLTRDNIRMIIPNSKFTSENVINWSKGEPLTRFVINIGVAYGSDTELVEKLLLEAANENKEVENNPPPEVIFDNFGDSALEFKLYFYTRNSFFVERIKSDIRKNIDKKFRNHRISIPFPQQDIYIKQIDWKKD